MELYQAGFIREAYQRQDRAGAVMMLESSSVEEARAQINSLPLVESGLTEFELIPLLPFNFS